MPVIIGHACTICKTKFTSKNSFKNAQACESLGTPKFGYARGFSFCALDNAFGKLNIFEDLGDLLSLFRVESPFVNSARIPKKVEWTITDRVIRRNTNAARFIHEPCYLLDCSAGTIWVFESELKRILADQTGKKVLKKKTKR